MSDILDRSTGVILGVLIAVVLICSALIPIVIGQINGLKSTFSTENHYSSDIVNLVTQYSDIIGIVILIVIIGLIIGVVKTYTGGTERD